MNQLFSLISRIILLNRRSLARICAVTLLSPIFWPVIGSFGIATEYTYASEEVNIPFGDTFSEVSRVGKIESVVKPGENNISPAPWSQIKLSSPKSSFVIKLRTSTEITEETPISFEIQGKNGEKGIGKIDLEGDETLN